MNGCRILAITVLLTLIFSMTAAAEITNVTIWTDEYIVLNNDIYIELLDVGTDMGWSTQVRFCSYLDPVGTTKTLYVGDVPSGYTSGTGLTIEVTLDSVFSNGSSFVIESSKNYTSPNEVPAEKKKTWTSMTTACLIYGIWTTAPLPATGLIRTDVGGCGVT
jgi:hypothetical protein